MIAAIFTCITSFRIKVGAKLIVDLKLTRKTCLRFLVPLAFALQDGRS